MNKTIKLKNPEIKEWIYAENSTVGQKQDGMKSEVIKYHISELSEQEALEYAEEYKKTFLQKYDSLKKV